MAACGTAASQVNGRRYHTALGAFFLTVTDLASDPLEGLEDGGTQGVIVGPYDYVRPRRDQMEGCVERRAGR